MLHFFKDGGDGKKMPDGKGKLLLFLVVAAIGVALILIGSGTGERKEQTNTVTEYRTEEDELVIYQQYLEERIKKLCESVSGVSDVTVTVTLSGGFESVYATEWKDGNEKYVILGSGASAEALYLTRSAPEISGIGIVCRGGETEQARYELIGLLSATYHVNSNRIYVARAD